MATYDSHTSYEMIDLAGLFDLDKARLIQAQINSIDSENNCADVTLSSECIDLSGKDVSAVKFFYHCENSSGTIEDLALGHKAFRPNDYVYCLFVPATDTVDERFFIVGHIDIRGTAKCLNPEILFMMLYGDTSTGNIYCLFDTSTGTLLDIENFVNIDASSPAKPSSSIGVYSTSFYSWLTYNFNTSISYVIPSYTASLRSASLLYASSATGSSTIAYTGTTGWITSSTPIDCDSWFDEGNGQFSTSASRSFTSYTAGELEGSQTCVISMHNPFGSHADQGDTYCSACWGSTQYNNVRTMKSGSIPHNGMRIWDGVDLVEYIVDLSFETKTTDTNITTLSDGVFNANSTHKVEASFSANFNAIIPSSPTFSVSSEVNCEFELSSWPPYGATSQPVPLVSETGDIVYSENSVDSFFMRADICDSLTTPNPLTIGTNGAYVIVCGAVFYEKVVAAGELFRGFEGSYSIGPDKYTVTSIPGGRGNGFGTKWEETWYEDIDGVETVVGETIPTGHFKVFPCAVASMYNSTFTGATGTSFTDILNNNSASISSGLSLSVSAMYDFMSDRLNTLGYTASAVKSFYNAHILGRVNVMPMLKKVI